MGSKAAGKPAAFALGGLVRTFVYVDGFNLYNRALINTPYKWLDLRALCKSLLGPQNDLLAIKYYTARVSGRRNPGQPARQSVYLRALTSLPEVKPYFGNFLDKSIRRPLVNPVPGLPRFVEVHTTEEKGSDVNLASHLVWDGAKGSYDVAVVLSKDTDLVEPIRIVKDEIGKVVGLICPDGDCPKTLRDVASFRRHIRHVHLASSQFPQIVALPNGGSVTKPVEW